MKILVISQVFPYPPHDGNVLPIYHFLRCLAPRVKYTLLTVCPPVSDPAWAEGRDIFESWGMRVEAVEPRPRGRLRQTLTCLSHGRPWANRFFRPELAAATRDLLAGEPWDAIHAEGILSAQHLPRQIGAGSVLIARDCLSLAHKEAWRVRHAPWELLSWLKIRQMEADLYARFDRIMAISPTDAAEMGRISPRARIELLPNGVDLAAFHPRPGLDEPETVVFTGAMDFAPNIDAVTWFAREIWPRVRERRPAARFLVVGRDPAQEVRALSAADPTITVTGRVDSIQDWMARAAVVVSPLRFGTGMKNKVLEGAAMGKAMVVTPSSLQDIALAPSRDLLAAESPGALADAVARLLANPDEREALGRHARQTVENQYAWEAMAERLWTAYRDVSGRNAEFEKG